VGAVNRRNAILCVFVTLVLGGCGSSGSSGPSATTWVTSVCNAVVPFQHDLQTRGQALQTSTAKNVTQVKQQLQSFMTALVADANAVVSRLSVAGTPSVADGKTLSSGLVMAFTTLRNAFVKAQGQVSALPTSSAAAFQSAAQGVLATIRSSVTGLGPSLSGLKSPALDKAAKATPACASITAGS
jgi:hypothetical protein